MFLVEIESGREELYETTTELASAIRRGTVGPQSRIYHRISSSWVSIAVHPEYRRMLAEQLRDPLPPLARNHWTFYGLEPRAREMEPAASDVGAAAPVSPDDPQAPSRWRSFFSRVLDILTSPPTPPVRSGS